MKNYIFLLAIAFASTSQAAIVITAGSGYFASAIHGLEVNGEVYNVTFSRYVSFDGKYGVGDPPPVVPTFYNDAAGAIAARHAIVAALNAGPIVPVEVGSSSSISPAILIPYRYELDPENFFRNAGVFHNLDFPSPQPPPWQVGGKYAGNIPDRGFIGFVFAEFHQVPEPASLAAWLGLLAAGASIAYRRRRQQ